MNEDQLRDILATQIDILEPGLVLLEKEKHIPNSLGTRGFIDLVARDVNRCDTCGHDFKNDKFMVDAATKRRAWACMCIVANVGQDAVDARAATDECSPSRTAKSCGPDAATLASSS